MTRGIVVALVAVPMLLGVGCATRRPANRAATDGLPPFSDAVASIDDKSGRPEDAINRSGRPKPADAGDGTVVRSDKDSSVGLASAMPDPVASSGEESRRENSGPADPLIGLGQQDPAGATPPSIPQTSPNQPIDLPAALRLADNQNPVIGEARTLILGALAQRQAAYALLLPTFNAGLNYHDHTGNLQRSNGVILPLTEQSFYVGGGARTLAAESIAIPAVNIFSPLADAIYDPLAAQQRVRSAGFNASATANETLLEVAQLYLELVGKRASYEAWRESSAEVDKITNSVVDFAIAGQGRRSDANRAETDRRLFQTQIIRAEESVAIASARLAERLNLDPSGRLEPMNAALEPITLIDPAVPAEVLIQSAIARRPDLESQRARVAEAEYQVKREKGRPFLPTIWVGFSGGAFGGGSNLIPPSLSHFAGRTDFDARAYWTLLNFGVGNAKLIKQRQAIMGQAEAEQVRILNLVRDEVVAARAQTRALSTQVEVARRRLSTAEDGYRQDRARLSETLAKPIEALDSLRLLAEARIALIEAITNYNREEFALFVSLGAPPPL